MRQGLRASGAALAAVLAAFVASPTCGGDPAPDWASGIGLFVTGGPPAMPVEIRLNGAEVAQVGPDTPPRIEVASWLRAGTNELLVVHRAAGERASGARRTTVSLARFEREGTRNVLGETLAEAVVPENPAAADCTDTIRFWAGPPPSSSAALAQRYWLFVNGPMIGYRVGVVAGETPLLTVTSGELVFELTPWLQPGKNPIRYRVEPTCAGEAVPDGGPLKLTLAAARPVAGGFDFNGPALGIEEFERASGAAPFERVRVLRAR